MKNFKTSLLATISATILALLARSASAATYYVAVNGDDSNPCSLNQPCASINNTINTRLRAGDTLYLRGGTYSNWDHGGINILGHVAGTSWSSPVKILNYPGERVTLFETGIYISSCGDYPINGNCPILENSATSRYLVVGSEDAERNLIVDGNDVSGGLYMDELSNIKIQNMRITRAWAQGIQGGGSNIFSGNEVDNGVKYASYRCDVGYDELNRDCYTMYYGGEGNIIENNIFHDWPSYGLHMRNLRGSIVRNNIFYNIGNTAFIDHQPEGGSGGGNEIYGNLFYNVGTSGHAFAAITVSRNFDSVYNNTIVNTNGTTGICAGRLTATIYNNLLINTNDGPEVTGCYAEDMPNLTQSHNIRASDPYVYFVNAGAADFRLKGDSPAIDQGVDVGLPYSGSAPDVGAFEYGTMPDPTPRPAVTPTPVPTPINYRCEGAIICDGTSVTASPGQQVCGQDLKMWACTNSGWQQQVSSCTCNDPGTFDTSPPAVIITSPTNGKSVNRFH
jgi:hypothetical protein